MFYEIPVVYKLFCLKYRILVAVNFGIGSADAATTVNLETEHDLIPGSAEVLVVTSEEMGINVRIG